MNQLKINLKNPTFLISSILILGIFYTKIFLSIGTILCGAFLIYALFFQRKKIRRKNLLVSTLLIYGVHLVGLIYSNDLQYAFNDLNIKLPWLLFPLFFAVSPALKRKETTYIIQFYWLCCVLTCIFNSMVYLEWITPKKAALLTNFRQISFFHSHIRFALSVAWAFLLLYATVRIKIWRVNKMWILSLPLFITMLIELQSILALSIVFAGIICIELYPFRSRRKIQVTLASVLLLMVFGFSYTYYTNFYQKINAQFSTKKDYSPNGTRYYHDTTNISLENNHLVNINIAFPEIEEAWNKRSVLNINTPSKNKFSIQSNIIRYLASKGKEKNFQEIMRLSDHEIIQIENGKNSIYKSGVLDRIDQMIIEIYSFINDGYIENATVAQRLEYQRIATMIFKQNPIIGVGTGDLNMHFKAFHQKEKRLSPKFWLRAHNQFFTFLVASGTIGFLLIIFAIYYPYFNLKGINKVVFSLFILLLSISFLSEDTLETQLGATFSAFWFSFLCWTPLQQKN